MNQTLTLPGLTLTTLLLATGLAAAQEWPMFRFDPGHSAATNAAAAIDNPQLLWRFATGGVVESSPAVTNGVVFFGAFDRHVYTLAPTLAKSAGGLLPGRASCRRRLSQGRWCSSAPSTGRSTRSTSRTAASAGVSRRRPPVFSSPAVAGSTLFIGSDDGFLYALDADSGELRWRFEAGREIFSSPSVADGTVFVGAHTGFVYTLDADTGALTWQTQIGGPVFSSPALLTDQLLIGSGDEHLYALAREDGAVQWRAQVGERVWTSPAVVGSRVYFGSHDGAIYALQETP